MYEVISFLFDAIKVISGMAFVVVGLQLAWQWHKETLEECER